jgi:hypothetical protein
MFNLVIDNQIVKEYATFKAIKPVVDKNDYESIDWNIEVASILAINTEGIERRIRFVENVKNCLTMMLDLSLRGSGLQDLRYKIEQNPGPEADELKEFLVWMKDDNG